MKAKTAATDRLNGKLTIVNYELERRCVIWVGYGPGGSPCRGWSAASCNDDGCGPDDSCLQVTSPASVSRWLEKRGLCPAAEFNRYLKSRGLERRDSHDMSDPLYALGSRIVPVNLVEKVDV